nr:MAG TPA: hypothetical protein [Caudoviricetes sp.]
MNSLCDYLFTKETLALCIVIMFLLCYIHPDR